MAEKLYRIGEAAKLFDVKTSVLRFWEDCFAELSPLRTEKGQRLYRESDLAVLRQIQHLLYERGLTIEGARRVLSHEDITTATEQASLFNFFPDGAVLSCKKRISASVPCDITSYHTDISEKSPVVATSCDNSGVLCDIVAELQRLRALLA